MISAQIERVEGTAIDGAYIFVLYFLPASLEIPISSRKFRDASKT